MKAPTMLRDLFHKITCSICGDTGTWPLASYTDTSVHVSARPEDVAALVVFDKMKGHQNFHSTERLDMHGVKYELFCPRCFRMGQTSVENGGGANVLKGVTREDIELVFCFNKIDRRGFYTRLDEPTTTLADNLGANYNVHTASGPGARGLKFCSYRYGFAQDIPGGDTVGVFLTLNTHCDNHGVHVESTIQWRINDGAWIDAAPLSNAPDDSVRNRIVAIICGHLAEVFKAALAEIRTEQVWDTDTFWHHVNKDVTLIGHYVNRIRDMKEKAYEGYLPIKQNGIWL